MKLPVEAATETKLLVEAVTYKKAILKKVEKLTGTQSWSSW